MLRRLAIIGSGAACGVLLAVAVAHVHRAWGWGSDAGLGRSVDDFRTVLDLVRTNYVDGREADPGWLTRAAFDGMVRSLDPHSEFLRADDYRTFREEMDGRFGGIGVQVELRDGRVVIVAPIFGTPADHAGVRRADQIVKINGRPAEGLGMDKVVLQLRGPPGTKVTVTLFRPSTKATFDVALTREIVRVESVRDARMIGDDMGYIQLAQFGERTSAEFKEALARLQKQGMKSLILDLRNNPGGLLDAAVAVAEPFFKPGELVVYTQGRTASSREELRAGRSAGGLGLPIAVLVNSGTASAAEIVAGALKDTGRAVIVGETTFGKGSVQTLFRLKDGEALRLTTAHYHTPGGAVINERGIEPQVKVVVTPEDEANVQLQRTRPDLAAPGEFAARFGMDPVPDRPLQTAIDVLRGVGLYLERSQGNRAAEGRGTP